MAHYHDDPTRQEQLFRELVRELRKQIIPIYETGNEYEGFDPGGL